MTPNTIYYVKRRFTDAARFTHSKGECWKYLSHSLEKDGVLTLTVEYEGETREIGLTGAASENPEEYLSLSNLEISDFEQAYRENNFALKTLYNKLNIKTIKDEVGQNLLHIAARYADDEAAEYLLSCEVPSEADDYGDTPLDILSKAIPDKESEERVERITKALGGKVAEKAALKSLTEAVLNQDLSAVKTFLKDSADVNLEDERYGLSPFAAELKYHFITPLTEEQEKTYFDIFNLLIKGGADVNKKVKRDEETPLFYVLRDLGGAHRLKLLEKLIAAGANVNTPVNISGAAPLSASLWMPFPEGRNLKAAEILLKAGADPNIANGNGDTPLMVHAGCGDETSQPIGARLIEAGAAIDGVNNSGLSVLMLAVTNAQGEASALKLCELLLKKGYSQTALKTDYKETALDMAIRLKRYSVVTLLRKQRTAGNSRSTTR